MLPAGGIGRMAALGSGPWEVPLLSQPLQRPHRPFRGGGEGGGSSSTVAAGKPVAEEALPAAAAAAGLVRGMGQGGSR